MAKKMKTMDWIAYILLMIGGINWGLTGLFDVNLVPMLTMNIMFLTKLVYGLVGLSGLYSLYKLKDLV